MQNELNSIRQSGLRVVGLSHEKAETLKNFATENGIQFPLLTDPENKVISQLGFNTARKNGDEDGDAHLLITFINRDRAIVGILRGTATKQHNSKQLIEAWAAMNRRDSKKKEMSRIKVRGRHFVGENGNEIVFKGLAISDPDKISNDGHWDKKHFETIKSWGVNLVRIPIHPARVDKRGLNKYLELLDEAVMWCGDLEMYIIIDWHSIGNLKSGKFESAEYETTVNDTKKFWKVISEHFAGNPTIAFYEIFNEPSRCFGDWGKCTWQEWKTIVEEIIDVIYANDKNVIPLVAGFDWAYDLRDVKVKPIERSGIAYVAHPYPGKCKPPREPHWEEHFGFLAERYPVIATEMGYYLKGNYDYMIDDINGTYRKAILKYLDRKKISWCAWVFDPEWEPALIKNYKYEPTHSGKFFKDAMLGK